MLERIEAGLTLVVLVQARSSKKTGLFKFWEYLDLSDALVLSEQA